MTNKPIAVGDEFRIPKSEYWQTFVVVYTDGRLIIAHDPAEKLGNRLSGPIGYGFGREYLDARAQVLGK